MSICKRISKWIGDGELELFEKKILLKFAAASSKPWVNYDGEPEIRPNLPYCNGYCGQGTIGYCTELRQACPHTTFLFQEVRANTCQWWVGDTNFLRVGEGESMLLLNGKNIEGESFFISDSAKFSQKYAQSGSVRAVESCFLKQKLTFKCFIQ